MSADQCQAMLQQLGESAPVLSPRICPKGFEDDALSHLCRTEQQRTQLISALEEFSAKSRACSFCKKDTGLLLPVSRWTLSFTAGTYQLKRLDLSCDLCYKVLHFLDQITHPEDEVISHFLKINNIDKSASAESLTPEQRNIYQQWMSLAYSLQLFANYTPLSIVDPAGASFTDRTDFQATVKNIVQEQKKATTTPKKSRRRSSSGKKNK